MTLMIGNNVPTLRDHREIITTITNIVMTRGEKIEEAMTKETTEIRNMITLIATETILNQETDTMSETKNIMTSEMVETIETNEIH